MFVCFRVCVYTCEGDGKEKAQIKATYYSTYVILAVKIRDETDVDQGWKPAVVQTHTKQKEIK